MGFFSKMKSRFQKDQETKVIKEIEKKRTESNYHKGLKKSRSQESFIFKLRKLTSRHNEVNEEYFNDLEEILIMSDINYSYVKELINNLKENSKVNKIKNPKELNELLFEYMFSIYLDKDETITNLNIKKDGNLNVILITGVNGSGKTTSIGKIANMYKKEGYKILLAAADTFRAGAVLQLEKWSIKNEVDIITPKKEGQDPASVVYEAIEKAIESSYDLLIIDTAGRLQNKKNLMNELGKINKIIVSKLQKKPNESLLVIDATTGQNGVNQAKEFNDVTNITGIVLTKMDSSSKGGIILSIKNSFNIPVKLIGLGEGIEDIEFFNISNYLKALTEDFIQDYD